MQIFTAHLESSHGTQVVEHWSRDESNHCHLCSTFLKHENFLTNIIC